MMPIKILPNQSRAFQTPAQAWAWALNIIEQFGDKIRTEDNQLCKEVMNLQITVLEPCNPANWPIQGSGWNLPALNTYTDTEILDPLAPKGFEYSYGERLFAYPGWWNADKQLDQIKYVIEKLKEKQNTRRAIAITWYPYKDNYSEHVPCLQSVDFLYRVGKLHLTAYFRSQDLLQAWPANVYGLSRLLSHVAEKAGMQPGSLTTISASAHTYEK